MIEAPARTGILAKLAKKLPHGSAAGVFQPQRVSFNYTSRCNAKCAICLEAGHQQKFSPYTVEEAGTVLREAARLTQPGIRNDLHLWGGEPFLDLELLCGIAAEANRLGFLRLSVATNGFWGRNLGSAGWQLARFAEAAGSCELSLQLSCDTYHNSQPILSVDDLANIIYLVKTEFPQIGIAINCMGTLTYETQHALAAALTRRFAGQGRRYIFDDDSSGKFFGGRQDGSRFTVEEQIATDHLQPSFCGRCSDRVPGLRARKLDPRQIASKDSPLDAYYAVGVDRQLYIHLEFGSPHILPMGNVLERSAEELVARVEMDPIAVSLLRHGYGEIYPQLKAVPGFDFDAWARQFCSFYDILMGLEQEVPVLPPPVVV